VPSKAQADKIMRSRFSSVAKGALEKEHSPAAMSDLRLKKLQTFMMEYEYSAGKIGRRLSSLQALGS